MNPNSRTVAVLFDLDDTLFDHQFSIRAGLEAVRRQFPALRRRPLDELVHEYHRALDAEYASLLMTSVERMLQARCARFQHLFGLCGERIELEQATVASRCYGETYKVSRRAVPGAVELITALRDQVRVGVVSNNFKSEQIEKLRQCGFENLIDVLVVSDEVRVAKPEPAIFHAALERLECSPEAAVMVGDSWKADVMGAYSAGIRAVWLNRHGEDCPDKTIAAEITAFLPMEQVANLLLE